MIQRRFRSLLLVLAIAAAILSTGCTTGFIAGAARTSAASFLTSVFSTAVNETLTSSP